MQAATINDYIARNAKYLDGQSAAAISQLSDGTWPSVLLALQALNPGATDPGIDCGVAITHETIADLDAARTHHWSERGIRSEIDLAGLSAIKYQRYQLRRGDERRSQVVVDLGDRRIVLY